MSKEYIIDAKNVSLGRVASKAAVFLMGKEDCDFAPNRISDVRVLIINAKDIKISARRAQQTRYYRHSGYIGSLKSQTLGELASKDLKKLIEKVVGGMLPNNRLRKLRKERLKVEL